MLDFFISPGNIKGHSIITIDFKQNYSYKYATSNTEDFSLNDLTFINILNIKGEYDIYLLNNVDNYLIIVETNNDNLDNINFGYKKINITDVLLLDNNLPTINLSYEDKIDYFITNKNYYYKITNTKINNLTTDIPLNDFYKFEKIYKNDLTLNNWITFIEVDNFNNPIGYFTKQITVFDKYNDYGLFNNILIKKGNNMCISLNYDDNDIMYYLCNNPFNPLNLTLNQLKNIKDIKFISNNVFPEFYTYIIAIKNDNNGKIIDWGFHLIKLEDINLNHVELNVDINPGYYDNSIIFNNFNSSILNDFNFNRYTNFILNNIIIEENTSYKVELNKNIEINCITKTKMGVFPKNFLIAKCTKFITSSYLKSKYIPNINDIQYTFLPGYRYNTTRLVIKNVLCDIAVNNKIINNVDYNNIQTKIGDIIEIIPKNMNFNNTIKYTIQEKDINPIELIFYPLDETTFNSIGETNSKIIVMNCPNDCISLIKTNAININEKLEKNKVVLYDTLLYNKQIKHLKVLYDNNIYICDMDIKPSFYNQLRTLDCELSKGSLKNTFNINIKEQGNIVYNFIDDKNKDLNLKFGDEIKNWFELKGNCLKYNNHSNLYVAKIINNKLYKLKKFNFDADIKNNIYYENPLEVNAKIFPGNKLNEIFVLLPKDELKYFYSNDKINVNLHSGGNMYTENSSIINNEMFNGLIYNQNFSPIPNNNIIIVDKSNPYITIQGMENGIIIKQSCYELRSLNNNLQLGDVNQNLNITDISLNIIKTNLNEYCINNAGKYLITNELDYNVNPIYLIKSGKVINGFDKFYIESKVILIYSVEPITITADNSIDYNNFYEWKITGKFKIDLNNL